MSEKNRVRPAGWLYALLISFTVLPVALLVFAVEKSQQAAQRTRDVEMSSSLRYRSIWLHTATHHKPSIYWQNDFLRMDKFRETLRAKYPREVAETDDEWEPFAAQLNSTEKVDWDTATRMSEAAFQLTRTLDKQAQDEAQESRLLLTLGTACLVLLFGGGFFVVRRLIAAEAILRENHDQIEHLLKDADAAREKLEIQNIQLEFLATTDGLTGLRNHRAFQERLHEDFQRATRYAEPLSILLFDVDRFKQYNDSFGHPAGDAVLRNVAQILQTHARSTDMAARYGGEEFIMVLSNTDETGARAMAERIRLALEVAVWEHREVTASFGVATLEKDTVSPAQLIAEADAALYFSKQQGRNRVTHYREMPQTAAQKQTS